MLAGSETRFFGQYADAVLCSVERDVTRIDKVVEGVEMLRAHHVRLLGATVAK
jgi:hypothetical protein